MNKKTNAYAKHFIFCAHLWELQDEIKELLTSGVNVIVNHYIYYGASHSIAQGLDHRFSKKNLLVFTKNFRLCLDSNSRMIAPDIVFFLDRDPLSLEEKKISQAYTRMIHDEWIRIKVPQDIDNIHSYIKLKLNESMGVTSSQALKYMCPL